MKKVFQDRFGKNHGNCFQAGRGGGRELRHSCDGAHSPRTERHKMKTIKIAGAVVVILGLAALALLRVFVAV